MIRFLAAFAVLPAAVAADVPRVMTDIAPIHSLVAQVMGNLGAPDVLLPPGADPHDFALRPSDAERLGAADMVFWVGEGLTPWLAEPLETLAGQAKHVSLLDADGWSPLEARQVDAVGEDHDHDYDHDHDHAHDHGHDHGDIDPHAWLDPVAAQAWVLAIAAELSIRDPDNAATYAANAEASVTALKDLEAKLAARLAGLDTRAYMLPHDGYRYFETRFGLAAQAAIAGLDARTPGPAQIAALRDKMVAEDVVCVFSDAEIGERWAAVITERTDAASVQIDGVGTGLAPGPALYGQLLDRLSKQFATCLRGGM